MRSLRSRRLVAGMVCVAVIVSVAAGCGGTASTASGPAAIVIVTERDFHISEPAHVPAGEVEFRVRNEGPDDHEFIVVRLGAGPLPLRTDGMTVDEEALSQATVGALEPGQAGGVRTFRLNLPPGRYETFCNMEGHFMGGMHRQFTVGP